MKSHTCNHQVPFVTSLLVTNPHNYPCPHCQKRLTLDKTGRRILLASIITAGLYGLIIGSLCLMSALQGAGMAQIIIVSLIGLAFGPLILLPLSYLGWRQSRCIERKKLESLRKIRQAKMTPVYQPKRHGLKRLVTSLSRC